MYGPGLLLVWGKKYLMPQSHVAKNSLILGKQPTKSIRQWLNTYHDLLLHSLKEAKVKSLLHVCPITSYFQSA
jgi:hypothetical protein